MHEDTDRKVYEFIVNCYNAGSLPSVRDICAAMGFKSAATAHRYISKLHDEGLVEKSGSTSRSVRPKAAGAVLIPLLTDDSSASGEYICWGAALGRCDNLFAVKPRFGMPDAAILPGDTVIAEKSDSASPASVAVIRKPDGSVGVCRGGAGGDVLGIVIAVQRVVI